MMARDQGRPEILGKSVVQRYAAALGSTVAAVLLRWALHPLLGTRLVFATVFLTVLGCGRFWGVGPSLLAALLGTLSVAAVAGVSDPLTVLVSLTVCCIAAWTIHLLRRANLNAGESARLAEDRLRQLREDAALRTREAQVSAQFRAVVESSVDAIISKDMNGTIQSWNRSAEQIFGYTAAEVIGQSISILVPPGHAREEADIIERIRRGGHVKHFETVRSRKGGREIHVSLTISPILDDSGKVVGVSNIARDISERKSLEEQLWQTQKLESLGVLAGGLAHDFNNLLTGIMGNASLAMYDLGESSPGWARMQEILQASERAALLVGQMLAYAGKGKYVVERLDLSSQVSEIVTLVQRSIPRLVELDLRLESGLPAVEADRSQIQQIIMNLTMNAAEAIGDRAGTVTVITRSGEANAERQVVLEVRDTGCGMNAETQARIFDPFFTTKFTGRGLGLAAVLGIIQAHHGTIGVESIPGKGSTFTVVLPAASLLPTPKAAEPQVDLRGYGNILVADDEELVQNMARITLQRYGYTVEVTGDGREAVDAFASRPKDFAAVLLDLTMPVMNGEEALRRIREIRPEVPVVLSSGFSEVEASQRFHDQSMAGFLQKPYTATALARIIKQAVRSVGPGVRPNAGAK
jgi:two-component system CheB/CheR fusion protein